jgi:hypothetical protein
MKVVKSASGGTVLKISRQEWFALGRRQGWLDKKAIAPQDDPGSEHFDVNGWADKPVPPSDRMQWDKFKGDGQFSEQMDAELGGEGGAPAVSQGRNYSDDMVQMYAAQQFKDWTPDDLKTLIGLLQQKAGE